MGDEGENEGMDKGPLAAFIFGTRPEAVKLAPVIECLRGEGRVRTCVVFSGQHRDLARPFLRLFKVRPDYDLKVMTERQPLSQLTERLMRRLDRVLGELRPDVVVVQGDTTTVLCGSLAAYYHRIPVAHVEAGLRSGDPYNPFPEEMNRRLADQIASLHFAPTPRAKENLLREGIKPDGIFITGNTVVDALLKFKASLPLAPSEGRKILLTTHRRENWGEPMRGIFEAVRRLAREYKDVEVVYPVHPNPVVRELAEEMLSGVERIRLLEPLPYEAFLRELASCYLVLTDSGGVQEEAPSFNKPVLVLRETTERPELLEVGGGKLVGTDAERIFEEASKLLSDEAEYQRMASAPNPFGDGRAAGRICAHLLNFLGLPAPEVDEFVPPRWGS